MLLRVVDCGLHRVRATDMRPASQGSLLAAPDVMGILERIHKCGKVIVIDPVRTQTAARATEWLPITPGTDAALLLAVVNTLFDEGLVKLGSRPRM